MAIARLHLDTHLGIIAIAGTADGITAVAFADSAEPIQPDLPACLHDCRDQLGEYFAGTRRSFDLPLAPEGSSFERRVWEILLDIPFGSTTSYGEIARLLGDPNTVRAVGAANGRNRLAIIVPCHRVIGADGSLTGYAGGLWRKEWLLAHEGVTRQQRLEQNPNGTGNGPSVRWVTLLHRPNGTIWFAATSTGLYSTMKLEGAATRWELEGASSIGNTVVDMVAARQSDGFVAVGSHGLGVYSSVITILGADDPTTPGGLALEQNVPNPVRDRTTILYAVPERMHVRLAVFDIRGREVASLHDGMVDAGRRSATFATAGLPAGTYYYRLESVSGVRTRPMQIVH